MKWDSEDSLKKFRQHFGIEKLTDTDFEQLKLNIIAALEEHKINTGDDVVVMEFYRGQLTNNQAQDLLEYLHYNGYKCDDGYIYYGYGVTLKIRWGDSKIALQKPFEFFLEKYSYEVSERNERRATC
jgi:crotonobetainyl-CoA:carnitine CoA-transferase CaiB-like acyl-CoA transferase